MNIGISFKKLPPIYITLTVVFIIFIMVLHFLYLFLRVSEANLQVLNIFFTMNYVYIILRSVLLMILVSLITLFIALPLAWINVRAALPMPNVWAVLLSLPLVIPTYVGAFLYSSILGPRGILQELLESIFGIKEIPDIHGLFGATLVLSLLSFPYLFLILKSSITNLDSTLIESSRLLGHSKIKTFFKISLPQLRPSIIAGTLFVSLYTLSDFGAVSLMRYNTLTWAIYQQYQSIIDRSIISLISLALVLIAVLIIFIESKFRNKSKYYKIGTGTSPRNKKTDLGIWSIPVLFIFGLIVFLSLILPLSGLFFWLIRGVSAGEPLVFIWELIYNSLFLSIATSLATVFLSMCMAIFLVRYNLIINKYLEIISLVGYVLPGVVIAISLVYFGINFVGFIYQTKLLLIIACIILAFPVALGNSKAVLLQINPEIEDSAKILSKNFLSVIIYVLIPMMKSGLIMSFALVFLLTMKELPATLILGPLGFQTLATSIWSSASEAYFARAAAPALSIIFLSLLPLILLMKSEDRPGIL